MSCTTNKKTMSSWWQNNEILGSSHEVWAKIEISLVFHRKNQKFAFCSTTSFQKFLLILVKFTLKVFVVVATFQVKIKLENESIHAYFSVAGLGPFGKTLLSTVYSLSNDNLIKFVVF